MSLIRNIWANIKNVAGIVINPATEEKQDDAITKLTDAVDLLTSVIKTNIHTNTDEVIVASKSHICVDNSSNIPLGINGIFQGAWQDCLDYSEIIISVFTDQNSVTDGMTIQWSADGIGIHGDDTFTISASSGKTFSFPCQNRYIRVKYQNDGVAQTSFVLQTLLKRFASKGSSHRIKDSLVQEDDAIVTKGLIAGKTTSGGGAIVDVKVNPSGALTVESTVTSSALPTGASTSANQTNGTQQTKITNGTDTAEVQTGWNTGHKGLRVFIGPTDPISDLPVIIPYDHHQVHEGETWHYDKYVANLATGTSYDIVFTVPTITPVGTESIIVRCPHFRYSVETNDLLNVFLYEAPTVTAATGTAKTPINFERNGTYTPKLAILDEPTITAVGTLIDSEYFLQGASGGKSGGGLGDTINEFVLKSGTKYLFRVTSGANGCDIHIDFHWYEDLGV